MDDDLNARAQLLRKLHERTPLVLPNAWDPASAALIAGVGAPAIATTSGGVAWSVGRPDGEGLRRDEMVEAVRRIVAAVDVPVTADIEGGYGSDPEAVGSAVRAIVEAGAVGVNIEDSRASDSLLYGPEEQRRRLLAAREAATATGLPDLVINARTDVYLFQVGDPAGRLDDVLNRADTYARAGADLLFVPGLLDLTTLESLVSAAPLPINVMAGPGGPTIAELGAVGVRRVTVGTGIAQAAYAVARHAAQELLSTGTYAALEPSVSYPELNALFARRR